MEMTDHEKVALIKANLEILSVPTNLPEDWGRWKHPREFYQNRLERLIELYKALPDEYFDA